jgi:hypothetical protein
LRPRKASDHGAFFVVWIKELAAKMVGGKSHNFHNPDVSVTISRWFVCAIQNLMTLLPIDLGEFHQTDRLD